MQPLLGWQDMQKFFLGPKPDAEIASVIEADAANAVRRATARSTVPAFADERG